MLGSRLPLFARSCHEKHPLGPPGAADRRTSHSALLHGFAVKLLGPSVIRTLASRVATHTATQWQLDSGPRKGTSVDVQMIDQESNHRTPCESKQMEP